MGFKNLPGHEIIDGMDVYRIKALRTKKEMCHPHEMLIFNSRAKRFLKKHLKNHSYDIVHDHFIIPTGIVARWVWKKFQIPYIITSHGSDVLNYNKRFKMLYPLLINTWNKVVKDAAHITTPSTFLKKEIQKNITADNISVIPHGIDATTFKPMPKKNTILIVARLFPNKGIQDILDALAGIDLGDWKIDIVGEGPYRSTLEKKVKEKHLTNSVTFHGWMDNKSQKMKKFYGQASIFISASYFESFGLTILEAISAGCTIITSDIDGIQEMKNDHVHVYQSGNVKQLHGAIKTVIASGTFTNTLDKRFHWKNIVSAYVTILKNASKK